MVRPLYIALEKSDLPTLVVDKEGSIGVGLFSKLKDLSQVVLVGSKKPQEEKNLLFLSYKQNIPEIPADSYGQIFFIINSVKELNELLPALSEKAKQDKAKFFVIGDRGVLTLEILQEIFSKSSIAKVVLLGDLFGNPLSHKKKSFIEEIIESAKTKKAIKLPGVGLSKIYPVSFEDAVIELVRLSFSYNKKNKLYFLHTQYPMTTLGLSHLLQKESPMLKIDFERDEKPSENDSIPVEGDYLLPEDYPASEKLQLFYKKPLKSGSNMEEEVFREEEPRKEIKIKSVPNLNILKTVLLTLLTFLISLITLPIIIGGVLGLFGEKNLQSALRNVQAGNIEAARKNVSLARHSFFLVKQIFPIISFEVSFIAKNQIPTIEEKIDLALSASNDFGKLLQISDSVKGVLNLKNDISKNSLIESIANIKNLFFISQQVINDKSSFFTPKVSQIDSLQKLERFINIVEVMPSILGDKKPKKYLVLFQNNAELRPGGGFIGSYANLNFDKGKVLDFSIHDVYDADGQLKGHIEPPYPIRRYIPQIHMYLRDSNFDVDFTKSAFMSAFLYEQEMHQKVDGVIAVDLSFFKELIGAVGQVYLPKYKETVTKDNFFLLAENHSEKNFFPGSSQKGDFLKDTFQALQEKIAKGEGGNYLKILEVLTTAASQKHLLFAFANSSIQDSFVVNGFSSSLWDNRKNNPENINDFLGVNEANLGVNKVNYFVTRSIDQKALINEDGSINIESSISLTNSSSGEWPSGPYKNYIRFIVPGGTTLNKLMVNGVEQKIVPAVTNFLQYESKNFLPPAGLEVDRTEESGKTIYGFLTAISSKENQKITILYKLPTKLDLNLPKLIYSNIYFKQPGTESYPYSFSLSIPKSFRVTKYSDGFKKQPLGVVYNENISSDKSINIEFAKN